MQLASKSDKCIEFVLFLYPVKKNELVDVTFTHAITHQKHIVQSGRSTQSAVDIFNTLSVFTKEPIREQEIKLVF